MIQSKVIKCLRFEISNQLEHLIAYNLTSLWWATKVLLFQKGQWGGKMIHVYYFRIIPSNKNYFMDDYVRKISLRGVYSFQYLICFWNGICLIFLRELSKRVVQSMHQTGKLWKNVEEVRNWLENWESYYNYVMYFITTKSTYLHIRFSFHITKVGKTISISPADIRTSSWKW